MHRVDRSVLVPYTSAQMFGLVAGIKDYPKFLPWCAGAAVSDAGAQAVQATIDIDFSGVRSRFTTRNENRAPELIRMQLIDGPFETLAGEWRFHALADAGCKVELNLRYTFAGGLLGRAIAPVFDAIAGSLVDAFARRAEALYGA